MYCIPFLFSILCGFLFTSSGNSWRIVYYNGTTPRERTSLRRELLSNRRHPVEIPILFSTSNAPSSLLFDDDYHLVVSNRSTIRPIVEMPDPEIAILVSVANVFVLFILVFLTLYYSVGNRVINYKMDLDAEEEEDDLDNEEKRQLLKEIDAFEFKILNYDIAYSPNPKLYPLHPKLYDTKNMKCDFRHKKCNNEPGYTDGNNNYCWTHSIIIQCDKYK